MRDSSSILRPGPLGASIGRLPRGDTIAWDQQLPEPVAALLPSELVHNKATNMAAEFGAKLNPTGSTQLYLIQAVADAIDSSGAKTTVVIYPPEFLFVLDVGQKSLLGGVFFWEPRYLGDPDFPEDSGLELRSISSADPTNLLYPLVAGRLLIGIRSGVSDSDAKAALEGLTTSEGPALRNVKVSGLYATADCAPCRENATGALVETRLPQEVKYATGNKVVRVGEFSPGWALKRLV